MDFWPFCFEQIFETEQDIIPKLTPKTTNRTKVLMQNNLQG